MIGDDEAAAHYRDVIRQATALMWQYGNIDGGHHKQWVIDQALRILLGDQYAAHRKAHETDDEDGNEYDWGEGIAP